MMTEYLEGKEFSVEELKATIVRQQLQTSYSVFCGSSLKNRGVQLVLDAVIDYLAITT